MTSWQNPEVPSYKDYQDLIDDFGEDITPEVMTKAVSLGYMIPEGMRLRVPYPRIYNAGKELVENGVPLDAVLTHVRLVRQEVDKLAERFIDMIVEHLVDEKYGPNLPEGEDVARRRSSSPASARSPRRWSTTARPGGEEHQQGAGGPAGERTGPPGKARRYRALPNATTCNASGFSPSPGHQPLTGEQPGGVIPPPS